jgi:hypothetical protein
VDPVEAAVAWSRGGPWGRGTVVREAAMGGDGAGGGESLGAVRRRSSRRWASRSSVAAGEEDGGGQMWLGFGDGIFISRCGTHSTVDGETKGASAIFFAGTGAMCQLWPRAPHRDDSRRLDGPSGVMGRFLTVF